MTGSLDQRGYEGEGPPIIRVGVVLAQDERTQIALDVPEAGYELLVPDTGTTGRHVAAAQVVFEAAGQNVIAVVASARVGVASKWRLQAPLHVQPAAGRAFQLPSGQSPSTVRFRNARVGRGFHWEKAVDVQIAGEFEVSNVQGRLLMLAHVPIESYLLGVITSEMAGDCPLEFLKAQCVVARSWTLARAERKHHDFDYCNDDCCQRFHGVGGATEAAWRAVEETAGQALLAVDGSIVDANYSKCCGGVTESPRFVWDRPKPGLTSHADAPASSVLQRMVPIDEANVSDYLRGRWLDDCDAYCSPNVVPASELSAFLGRVDVKGSYFRWRISYRREQLEDVLRSKLLGRADTLSVDTLGKLEDLQVTARGRSGRATEMVITFSDAEGRRRSLKVSDQYRIRDALHPSFLYSSAFEIDMVRHVDGTPESVVLIGAGWGHGAGLCQLGALGMALRGLDYRQILSHYFRNTTVQLFY